jgi:hypothetical protein
LAGAGAAGGGVADLGGQWVKSVTTSCIIRTSSFLPTYSNLD